LGRLRQSHILRGQTAFPGYTDQIVKKARLNKTPVWYLMGENEGHGFAKKDNADFAYSAMTKFADDILLKDKGAAQ
jgi:dipeptidyl aminopeptidase/acylaminoacyl peptidase